MIIKERILFTNNECQSIIWNTQSNITNWSMGDREYDSKSIQYSDETKWIFDKLRIFFELETNIKLSENKKEIHFHKFIKGNWFGKHNDVREGRMYGVGVLLNDNFEGGNFILYNPNEYLLNKSIGNTYIFDVRIEHEITPIIEGERFSLLWFLEYQHLKGIINKLI